MHRQSVINFIFVGIIGLVKGNQKFREFNHYEDSNLLNQPTDKDELAELSCEETIMNEKERFGRVRTSMMKKLRKEHGEKIANRVLMRINKRLSVGSLNIEEHLRRDY